MSPEILVYGLESRYLGQANSFGEAKRMQEASLPEDLRAAYAGFQNGHPVFYVAAMTSELLAKYPNIGAD